MKWPLIASFLFLLLAEPALAQSLTRIVVLPFNAGQSADTYAIGLAAGLERSLNVIDGVFVPPVLLASLGAALVGLLLLGPPLWQRLVG